MHTTCNQIYNMQQNWNNNKENPQQRKAQEQVYSLWYSTPANTSCLHMPMEETVAKLLCEVGVIQTLKQDRKTSNKKRTLYSSFTSECKHKSSQ